VGDGRPAVRVEEVRSVDPALVDAMVELVPQLSTSAPPPTAVELAAIVDSPATVLFAALDEDGTIVGSLTLALFRVPTGMRAWIEDVVVHGRTRGMGVGAALVEAAIARAGAAGARTVDLTSRPSRADANRLYQRLGFEPRNTNVYRWSEES
jgi:ribosomal protein S18 acetylase RimI-like enzyme